MVNKYEEIRKQNIADNRRILAELGLLNPFKPLGRVVKKSVKRKRNLSGEDWVSSKKRAVEVKENLENYGSIRGSKRRSSRIQGKAPLEGDELKDEVERFVEEENESRPKITPQRPKFYGAVEGVEVGTVWLTRMEACRVGVHRPPVSGIHSGEDGAYSIALSGGYEDDIDLGDCFTYTGEGGRDLKGTKSNPKNLRTAAQSKDQTLTRGNLALSKNCETGNPVRVIRGYKLRGPFAPEDGYRYDGLYTVEKAWFTIGLSGFGVWKFALRRSTDQAPPPWDIIDNNTSPIKMEEKSDEENSPVKRVEKAEADISDGESTNDKTEVDKESTNQPADQDLTTADSKSCSEELVKTDKPERSKSENKQADVDNEELEKIVTEPETVKVDENTTDEKIAEHKSDTDSGFDSDSGSRSGEVLTVAVDK